MDQVKISLTTQFFIATSVILVTFIYWISRRQDYFKNLNIPYIKSIPLLGAFDNVVLKKTGFYDNILDLCSRPEVKGKPFFGMFVFHKPALMINDPELIKKILVKDFNSFSERYSGSDIHDPLGYYNLFSAKIALWKKMRNKMTPFFSSAKLKAMFYLIDRLGNDLNNFVHKRLDNESKVELELKDLSGRFSTDVIASCAYGVEANSLENPDAEFGQAGKSMFTVTFKRGIEITSFFLLPQIMRLFRFTFLSTFTTKFIQATIPYVISERIKSGNKRNDLIDTLIELKNNDETLTDDILMAQAGVFFAAGFETSSTTQAFALYLIAMNEGVQDRVRNEIREMLVRTEGKVTYDALMNISEMPYLHQVITETGRMFPIIPILDRLCIEPEGYSLEPFSDFKIPYGMPVYVPIFSLHRNEKYYPEPMKFDPERFAPDNVGNITPFTNFQFGAGPRNCIGERLGLMQVKTGIVKILKDFRLEPTENTPKEIVLEKNALVIQADKGLYFNFVKDQLYQ